MILYCIQATCYPCDDLWRVKLMAFLVPCSFSFTNKDCQGLHSKYKIYSLQWKNVPECDGGNKDVKLPALVRRTKQITNRHNLISGLCWFHGKNYYIFMFNVCMWILCAHVYLISFDGGLLLLLLLPYGVVLLLKLLQLFLADLLGSKSRKQQMFGTHPLY